MAAPIRFQPSTNNVKDWDSQVVDFKGYNGSPNLKKSGVQVEFTQEMMDEWKKCYDDPVYFAEQYIKIVHVDRGLIPIVLYDYQLEIIDKFINNRKTLCLTSRQAGKTTTAVVIILHYALFNKHKLIGLLANKGDAALEIMSRIQLAYEYLPRWLQSGVVEWNKGSIELENGCKIIASATSGSAIRGKSCVGENTQVKIRQLGFMRSVTMRELGDLLPAECEIFDGEQYRHFDSLLVQEKEMFHIVCEHDTIEATADHRFLTINNDWVYVDALNESTYLQGGGKFLFKTSLGINKVYDPINVALTNRYQSNKFISHNCAFLYIDECVTGDTWVTIEKHGVSRKVVVKELHLMLGAADVAPNNGWQVLTSEGFKEFESVSYQYADTIRLEFSDGSSLGCTHAHLLQLGNNEFIEAGTLLPGTIMSTGIRLVSVEDEGHQAVYDVMTVDVTSHYITNNVTSHNCAFVNGWSEFYTSVYPTISSGENTKMLFTSTPNGLNHYYKFWVDAKENRNGFAWVEVKWNSVPGRGDKWYQETIAAMSFDTEKFAQEFECQFMGSSGTLISGSALKALVHQEPLYAWEGFNQYNIPGKDHIYTIICDVSRGKGLDYSAFQVIDITTMPYKQVATYKNNMVGPSDYAHIINKIGITYNTAYVLVEINDIGGQVADLLFDELDYDNLLHTMTHPGKGKIIVGGGSNVDHGVRTTTTVKARGCAIAKLLIEQQQLIIQDFNTINELSRFSKKGNSYEAEKDSHDDLVMGLVLFAWLTTQAYFSNMTSVNTLNNLRENEDSLSDFVPFGFIDTGDDDDMVEIDNAGTAWMRTDAWNMQYPS